MKTNCSALGGEEAFDSGAELSGTGFAKGMRDDKTIELVDNDEERPSDFVRLNGNVKLDACRLRSSSPAIRKSFSLDHSVLAMPWQLVAVPCLMVLMTVSVMIYLHASNVMVVVFAVLVIAAVGIWLFTFLRSSLEVAARDFDETNATSRYRTHDHGMHAPERLLEAIRCVETEAMEMIGGGADPTKIDIVNGDAVSENTRHRGEVSIRDGESAGSTGDGVDRVPETAALHELLATEVRLATQAIRDMGREKAEICRSLDNLKDTARAINRLAKSAAIEASRAGKSACEISATSACVRDLTNLSQDVTGKMQALVGRLQDTLALVERVTTNDPSSIPGGTSLALRAIDALRSIRGSVTSLRSMCERIAIAIERQRAIASETSQRLIALQELQRAEDRPRKLH